MACPSSILESSVTHTEVESPGRCANLPKEDPRDKSSVQVLVYTMRQVLALAHPMMPFITEELWSTLPSSETMLISSPWPSHKDAIDSNSLSNFQVLFDLYKLIVSLIAPQ